MTTTQQWDPKLYDTQHAIITRFGEGLIDLLAPQAGERILDLGCGTGHLTQQLAERGVRVVGSDNSREMIETARAAYPQLEFHLADAADFHFDAPFDAVFSNAVLHWVTNAEGVIRSVAAALKPGGRFVLDMGGKHNIANIISGVNEAHDALGMPRPQIDWWYFPSPGDYAPLLEKHGFRVSYMAHFDRPTPLQGDDAIGNWLLQFMPMMLNAVPEDRRAELVREVENHTRAKLHRDGTWYADYVRLRVIAHRTGSD